MDELKRAGLRAAFVGALAALSLPCAAATYYVAVNGSDSAAGSSAAPFQTIQRGVNAAAPGDTIVVGDGTYLYSGGSQGTHVSINKAGSSGAWITLRAQNKGRAFLNGNNNLGGYAFTFGGSSAYWIIQGFDISMYYFMGAISNSGGGKYLQFRGNHIHHIGNHDNTTAYGEVGIYTDGSASNVVIDGNVFNDVGRTGHLTGSHDHAIYTHGTNVQVTNNVFYNTLNGWHLQTASGFSGTIANNTFFGPNPYPGKVGQIMLWDPNSNVVIRNNIFYNARSYAITTYTSSVSGGCTIDHNLAYTAGASVALVDTMPSGCTQSNNRFNIDPLLVTPAVPSFDFHLKTGSPAIDQGAAVAGVTADFDGAARPQGAAFDQGAFEYAGAAPPPVADVTPPVISGVATSGVGQSGATIGWTTNEASDSQVEYGATSAYGASSALNTAMQSAHSVILGGLAAGTLHHYRAKSRDAAGNLAVSPDGTFTTASGGVAAGCMLSAGAWANTAFSAQSGGFTVEYDAVPAAANMDGVSGLSNGPASDYSKLAAIVRFNNTGYVDARNGGAYSAAGPIPYAPGLTYHIRLVVNLAAHTYSAYVKQGAGPEQTIGLNMAFRTEMNTATLLNNVGLSASTGSETVCSMTAATAAPSDTAPPVITGVAASAIVQNGATIGWTTNEAADTQVEFGLTTAYGAATFLNSSLVTAHSALIGGLTSGTVYHYRVKSKDAAGNLAVSPDATFTTAAPAPACLVAAGNWKNLPIAARTGSFGIEYDAVPTAGNIDGVSGLSKGPAADYSALAVIMRFNNTGYLDARNGNAYASSTRIPYTAGATYHIRLAVNVAAHTYGAYVRQGTGAEQTVCASCAFRTEQAGVASLDNIGVNTSSGGLSVCNAALK